MNNDFDEKAQSGYIYVDAGVQALLVISFFGSLFSGGLSVAEDIFWGASVTWIPTLFVWQIGNALAVKYLHEVDFYDKYLRYAGYTVLGIALFFGLVGVISFIEAVANVFMFFLFIWAYMIWIALYAHLLLYIFVGWYIYLTGWRIANRWNNQVY